MSRRKNNRRGRTPEEQAAEIAAKAVRKAEVEALRARGLTVRCDAGYNILGIYQMDAFSLLHSRKALTDAQLYAVRRLEGDMALALGHERPEQTMDRVSSSCEGAPGQNVSQAMIDAAERVAYIFDYTGAHTRAILEALLTDNNACLTRWRPTMHRITGEKDERAHGALMRSSAENLSLAWQRWDYTGRLEARQAKRARVAA